MGPSPTQPDEPNSRIGTQVEGLGRGSDAPPGKASDPRKVIFSKDAAGFLTELRRRVDDYFLRTGKSRNGGWRMYLKSAIILTAFAASYLMLVFEAQTWWQAVPLALLLGVSMALIGFNIQHDGGHHSYSQH